MAIRVFQRSPRIREVTRRWQLAFGECREYIQQKLLAKRNEDPGWTIGMIRRGGKARRGVSLGGCGVPRASETYHAEGDGPSSNAPRMPARGWKEPADANVVFKYGGDAWLTLRSRR